MCSANIFCTASNKLVVFKYEDLLKIQPVTIEEDKSIIEVSCPNCHKNFIPSLQLRMGNRYIFTEPKLETYIERSILFTFPREYKKSIERLALQANTSVKIKVTELKAFYPSIFWNSIWYFSKLNLPFDLFLPYKKDIFYEEVVQNVSQVTISDVKNWNDEDKDELNMQKQYEEKIRKKIPYKDMKIQTVNANNDESKQ